MPAAPAVWPGGSASTESAVGRFTLTTARTISARLTTTTAMKTQSRRLRYVGERITRKNRITSKKRAPDVNNNASSRFRDAAERWKSQATMRMTTSARATPRPCADMASPARVVRPPSRQSFAMVLMLCIAGSRGGTLREMRHVDVEKRLLVVRQARARAGDEQHAGRARRSGPRDSPRAFRRRRSRRAQVQPRAREIGHYSREHDEGREGQRLWRRNAGRGQEPHDDALGRADPRD